MAETETKELTKAPQTVGELLVSKKKQLEMALPKHLSVDRLLRICMTEISKNPRLQECTAPSLIGAILQAAQLGLEPGSHLGHCYLIPFRNKNKNCMEVQFVAGYKGLIDLARRSGQVTSIVARAVYANDEYDFSYGIEEKLVHVPAKASRKDLVAVYSICRFKDGGSQFEWMWKSEVEEIRKDSKSANDGPWVTDYEEMSKKTVVRRLSKYLPLSPEMQAAVTMDEYAEKGIPQENALLIEDAIDPQLSSTGSSGPARISAIVPKAQSATSTDQSGSANAAADPTSFGNATATVIRSAETVAPQKSRADLIKELLDAIRAGGVTNAGYELNERCKREFGKIPTDVTDADLAELLERIRGNSQGKARVIK